MKTTSFKISDELRARAEQWCAEHDRPFSYLMRIALEHFLDSMGK